MNFICWLCFIFLTGYLIYTWLRPWLRAVKLALCLPGPPNLPLLGNIFSNCNHPDFLKLFTTSYNKYPIFRGWLCFIPVIFILEPKYLQLILRSNKLTEKPFIYLLMRTFVGEGLLTDSGHKWRSHRKYIQPFFNTYILRQFLPILSKYSQDLIKNLKNHNQIKTTEVINKCVFDMLHEAVLGISPNDRNSKEVSPFNQGEKTFLNRLLRPWLLLNFTYMLTPGAKRDIQQKQTITEYAKTALETLKKNKKNTQVYKWCFLECLLEISENNSDFTEEDVVNEACTLMLAGQDSVGAQVSFALYYLAKHQDIQDKVVNELHNVFLNSSEINMETLTEMKYLEQCIKEVMRICPSVPLFARTMSEDVNLGEQVLPAGCIVFLAPIGTHRLPQYYPNPEKFDPERFSTENEKLRHPFSFVPFSAGPRNCIGYKLAMLEMKTIISTLLMNYQFSIIPERGELTTVFRLTLRARGGIWLAIKPRN